MLDQLYAYAERKGLAIEPGFESRDVKWGLVFDAQGRYTGVNELGDPSQKKNPGRHFRQCPCLSFSELRGGGAGQPRSHALVETADTVALLTKPGESDDNLRRLAGKHRWFVDTTKRLAAAVPALEPIAGALDDEGTLERIRTDLAEHKAKPTDKVTVAVANGGIEFPVDSDAWHDAWRDFRKTLEPAKKPSGRGKKKKPASSEMRCFVTGELVEPMKVQPKIAGLSDVGGLSMGDVLAAFKQDAFCSYGLKQASNAAVSDEAGAAYAAALHDLIRNGSKRLASVRVAHWYKTPLPPEDDLASWLTREKDETAEFDAKSRANELLQAIRSGTRPDLAGNSYYALTLSGNSGRVMIRDWMQGPFEELVETVKAWFDDLAIVRRDGQGLAPDPKFLAVLGSTVRELKELKAPLETAMWRTALRRLPIPAEAMARALARVRIDAIQNNVHNHARMGLLKAYHIRQGDRHMTPALNENHPHPAYHCGRLMAVLAELQRAALGDVGAGVIQRYYAAASTTPALVLGRLLRTSQFHVNKLEPGLAHWFEQRKADILGRIVDTIPSNLSLDEQSLFALGYYHQMAAPRKAKQPAGDAAAQDASTAD